MAYALKRLSLGVLLIVAASAILLVADWGRRATGGAPRGAGSARATDGRGLTRAWRLSFIQLNSVIDVEEAEKGVRSGLREAGLVEGRDIEIAVRNAQGDMATVSGLIDASLADGADLLVPFSTPTLQAAMQRTKTVPIVFNYVANAVAAGAGTSDTDHVRNVTGVYMVAAYDQMLAIVRAYMPSAHVLGTVYVPAEVNMVIQRETLLKAAAKAGFELKAVAANSSGEVADAALALVSSGIDAICQIPGNLTASAFPSIVQAARQARLATFVFQSSQVIAGATVGVVRDYYDSGREAGGLAARIVRGESPATIPFVAFTGTRLMVNLNAARQIGRPLPQSVVSRADEVIGK